jgi:hypothetical protein
MDNDQRTLSARLADGDAVLAGPGTGIEPDSPKATSNDTTRHALAKCHPEWRGPSSLRPTNRAGVFPHAPQDLTLYGQRHCLEELRIAECGLRIEYLGLANSQSSIRNPQLGDLPLASMR